MVETRLDLPREVVRLAEKDFDYSERRLSERAYFKATRKRRKKPKNVRLTQFESPSYGD